MKCLKCYRPLKPGDVDFCTSCRQEIIQQGREVRNAGGFRDCAGGCGRRSDKFAMRYIAGVVEYYCRECLAELNESEGD